ncbi:MAG: hypothetical protein JXR73_21820 [Candidatus Omnitrophica bacterium]|nr:hypothetical protein [Candidatus Omnitrophota bacterium]
MLRKRFLRDRVIDDMLDEIRMASERSGQSDGAQVLLSNSMLSLTELYEGNKIVLTILEDSIEKLRSEGVNSQIVDKLIEAATQIQVSMVKIHNSLKKTF